MPSSDVAARAKAFLLALIVAALAFGLAFAIREKNTRDTAMKSAQRTASSGIAAPVEPQPTEPLPPPTENGDFTPPATVYEDMTGSIRVTNMGKGAFFNGTVVQGTAVAFESRFSWKLEDANGAVIVEGHAMARQPDMGVPGPFAFPVVFDRVPTTTEGTFVLYEASAKDGSPIHVVRIPVVFSQKTRTVKVYFGNSKMNPNAMDCSLVYPVERTLPDGDVYVIAVDALLKGPTKEEKAAGYYSNIPDGVVIQSAGVGEGEVFLDFNQALQQDVGGSCRVTAIRSEIVTTASQGPQQEGVIISIDGRTEDILQP